MVFKQIHPQMEFKLEDKNNKYLQLQNLSK
jgi:hypothetical protein